MSPKFYVRAGAKFLALVFGLPLTGAATPCLYRGLDTDARVMNRSGEISTPFPTSLSSLDCRRLRVASGSVAVYVVGPEGVLTTRQVSRGSLTPVSEGQPDAASTDSTSILMQIKVVLEGINRTKSGSSRGAEGEYLVSILPTGLLAQPKADLVIELGPMPDMNLVSFELLSKGKVVHRHTGPSQVIKLPAALLVAGAHLSWKLNYSGSKYEGSFRVEPASTLAALQQTMLKDAQGDPDEFVVKLRVASGLSKEGYFWDARELIRVALGQ